MRSIPYLSILQRAALLGGIQPAQLQNEDAAVFNVGIDRGLRHAWEFAYWPETTEVAEFHYRPDYAAGTTYAAGDEVYDPTGEAYYRAAQSSTGQSLADPAYWTPLAGTDWDIYVPWGTGGLPEGAAVRRCLAHNPRVKPGTAELDFSISADGVHPIRNVPASLWIEYRRPCPSWNGDTFSATATYAPEAQVYWTADYYRCLATTTAGETPASAATKWEKLTIPWRFGDYAAHSAAADKYRADGQLEKALAEQTMADDRLYDQLIIHEAQSRQQRWQRY